MATPLVKTITRETLALHPRDGKYQDKPVLVSLEGGDMLSFRIKGTQQIYTVSLGHCMNLATMLTMESQYRVKLDIYKDKVKLKKKGQYLGRVVKPKRPAMPFNKIYFKATK